MGAARWSKILGYASSLEERWKTCIFVDEVWQSWQHRWNDASFKSIRERQSRNFHSEIGGPGFGVSRHGCGSISLAEHARRIVTNFFFHFLKLSQFLYI